MGTVNASDRNVRCRRGENFCELNPQVAFAMNWHIEVIAAKLAAVREG